MPRRIIKFLTRDGQKAATGIRDDVAIPAGGGSVDTSVTIEALKEISSIVEINITTKPYRATYKPQDISFDGNVVALTVDAVSDTAGSTMTVEVTALGT